MSAGAMRPPLSGKIQKRDVRKGTHSCWECKRRKMRCTFDMNNRDGICQSCRRRGTACIGQEFPEELAMNLSTKTGEPAEIRETARISANNDGATTTFPLAQSPHPETHIATPDSIYSGPSRRRPVYSVEVSMIGYDLSEIIAADKRLSSQRNTAKVLSMASSHEGLSLLLYTSLPSPEDLNKIHGASPPSVVPIHEIMTKPYSSHFHHDNDSERRQLELPQATWHPVLIARYMLILASTLQHLHPDIHPEIQGLSETPRAISERLVSLVNRHITTRDDLLGSLEMLDCIMIESVYQTNLGNLRRGWMGARRALSVAQLMGLHCVGRCSQYESLSNTPTYSPRSMWYRLIYLERFLSLMLGIPGGCSDTSMSSEAILRSEDTEFGPLERIHCVVASRILERQGSEPTRHDLDLTQELDMELQKAARSLPAKWWLVPRLDAGCADLHWHSGRIFAQILHYNLLNQLYLPYMLRSFPGDQSFQYCRITCVNASREILTRFIALRSFNAIATSCHITDFVALMAALTLFFAHMDARSCGSRNMLAHQFLSDRAMIEQIQETMEGDGVTRDPLSSTSADLLRRVLAIDAQGEHDAELGKSSRPTVSVHPSSASSTNHYRDEDEEASGILHVHIPYFGIVKITNTRFLNDRLAQDPSSSVTEAEPSPYTSRDHPTSMDSLDHRPSSSEGTIHHDESISSSASTGSDTINILGKSLNSHQDSPAMYLPIAPAPSSQSLSYSKNDGGGGVMSTAFPGIASGLDGWALQGVDMAFFDRIMTSVDMSNGDDFNGVNPQGVC